MPFERIQRFVHRNDPVVCLPAAPPPAHQSFPGTSVFPNTAPGYPVCPPCPTGAVAPGFAPAASSFQGTGRHEKAHQQVKSLSASLHQGEEISTTLKPEHGFAIREPKQISLRYEDGKTGKTPVLVEKVNGKEVPSNMQIRYFADGKLYNERGEVEGRFSLTSEPHKTQKDHPLFLVSGILTSEKTGCSQSYSWSHLSLEGKPTLIINAAPPGLVRIVRKVDCQPVEDSKNGLGPFKDGTRNDFYEAVWVTPAQKAAHEKTIRTCESIEAEIRSAKLLADRNGVCTLGDGTKVKRTLEGYSFVRETVIVTSTWNALAKTGVSVMEACPHEGKQVQPKGALPDVPPPPREVAAPSKPLTEANPPMTQPEPIAKTAASVDPKGAQDLGLSQAEPYAKAHSTVVRESQQRVFQFGRARIEALRLFAEDAKVTIPETVLSKESMQSNSPKALADALQREVVAPFNGLDEHMKHRSGELNLSTSLRFKKSIERTEETIKALRQMSDTSSVEDVDKVLRRLAGEFSALEAQFAKDFSLKHFKSDELMGMTEQSHLDELIRFGAVSPSCTLKHVNDKAVDIQSVLKRRKRVED